MILIVGGCVGFRKGRLMGLWGVVKLVGGMRPGCRIG